MVITFLAICIVIPIVWHWFSFDRAEVSARAAFLVGTGWAVYVWVRQSWEFGLLVFFLATFLEFAVAYVIGLIYSLFASAARADHMDRLKSAKPSERHSMRGVVGAIAIPLGVLAAWVVHGLQTDNWDVLPTKSLLGFCAFLILGVAAAAKYVLAGRKATRIATT